MPYYKTEKWDIVDYEQKGAIIEFLIPNKGKYIEKSINNPIDRIFLIDIKNKYDLNINLDIV